MQKVFVELSTRLRVNVCRIVLMMVVVVVMIGMRMMAIVVPRRGGGWRQRHWRKVVDGERDRFQIGVLHLTQRGLARTLDEGEQIADLFVHLLVFLALKLAYKREKS